MVRSSRRSLFLVVFILVSCGFLGMLFAQKANPAATSNGDSDVRDSLKQFTQVYQVVEENYAEAVNPDKAIYNGAIPGCCTPSTRTPIFLIPSRILYFAKNSAANITA